MIGLEPKLDTAPIDDESTEAKTTFVDDNLGSMLQAKWLQWSTVRREIEEEWLRDLRAFNQQNEPDAEKLSKLHSHIYIGITRTKCMSAYSRITDLEFQSNDPHWSIVPTPIPESEANHPDNVQFMDEMTLRAEAMSTEIADQMVDLHYEDHLKSAILEGCILGTGVVKGVIAGVKKIEKWGYVADEETGESKWDVIKSEIPAPEIASPSIFDVYPDPFANRKEDMSGCFERHTMNRQQFADLKHDPRFDEDKINEILINTDKGNHVAIWHETERRNIAGVLDSTAAHSERYDVLEYWGQVSGRLLDQVGVVDVESSETYWAIVWTCAGKTLLAKLMPMKKQTIPYNFFIYNKIPHQFWGVSPARMGRSSQLCINGVVRSTLDGMAWASHPIVEVNVTMLKDGQDPSNIYPGMSFLRDNGDPAVPAVRFYQPNIPTGQLIQLNQMFKTFADDETALPAYSYGDSSGEINKTAQGMTLQMNAAAMPIKSVAKNLEDFCVKPLIGSWFDWNMQWSDREDIKGDMTVQVLGTSALIAKEKKSQQLMQFLQLTSTPLDMSYVDRKYLLTQIAKSIEIDVKKAIPDQMPENSLPPAPPPNPLDVANAELIKAKIATEAENTKLMMANIANMNVKTEFASMQAAGQVVMQPQIVPVADALMKSAGFVDANGFPSTLAPEQAMGQNMGNALMPEPNTSPGFPANPGQVNMPQPIMQQPLQPQSPDVGANQGIETMRND